MIRFILHIILVIWGMSTTAFGQDVHFSQTENSHLNLNPALCGFENDLSINSNYKTQWKVHLCNTRKHARNNGTTDLYNVCVMVENTKL